MNTSYQQTITTQNTSSKIVYLRLREEAFDDGSCKSSIQKLNQILKLFAFEDDKLSKSLRDWGVMWSAIIPENLQNPDDLSDDQHEQFMGNIEKQFDDLKRLLRNNFVPDSDLAKDILYDKDEGIVWDKADYEIYKRINPFKYSPYSPHNLQKQLSALPHPFANAIVEWTKNFSELVFCPFVEEDVEQIVGDAASKALNSISQSIVEAQPSLFLKLRNHCIQLGDALGSSEYAPYLLVIYDNLAQKALIQISLDQANSKLTKVANDCQNSVLQLKELLKQEAEKAREATRVQREDLEKRLDSLKNDYDATISIIEAKRTDLEKNLASEQRNSQIKKELLESLENKLSANLADQLAMQEQHVQQQNEDRQHFEERIQKLRLQVEAEKSNTDQKTSLISSLEFQINTAIAEQAAQEQRRNEQHALSENRINDLRQQITNEQRNVQQQQTLVLSLQNKINLSIKEQAAQAQLHEQQLVQLRATLEAQMVQMVAEQTQLRQQQVTALMNELTEEKNRLALRIQENSIVQNQLKGQITQLHQQCTQAQAQVNHLNAVSAQQQQVIQQNIQQITTLTSNEKAHAEAVQHLKHKVKKASKGKKICGIKFKL